MEMTDTGLIERIVDAATGELASWQRPISGKGIGPAFPEVYDRFEADRASLRDKLCKALSLLPEAELAQIVPESEAAALNPLFDLQVETAVQN